MAAMAIGGAGQASALTVEEIANLTGPDRQKILEAGAKKEGKILWVGSLNNKNAKPILAGFKKRYPYIDLKKIRTNSTKALQRVLAELRAKTYRIDFITSGLVVDMVDAGAITKFRSPVIDKYAKEVRDPTRYSHTLYTQYFGLAGFSTAQLSAKDAPKSWDDLLDPKWKGQMVWGSSPTGGAPFVISFLRKHWGEKKARSYFKKLAKQKIRTRSGSARTVLGMTITGEHKIMINPYLSHIAQGIKKKAPVGVTKHDPVPVSTSTYSVSKFAPHPHATMLLVDYVSDKEAQSFLAKKNYISAHPDVKLSKAMRAFAPSKGTKRIFVDNATLHKLTPESVKIHTSLFQ
jgi:ABC-type Fe3+ transport system substrate-binding protein